MIRKSLWALTYAISLSILLITPVNAESPGFQLFFIFFGIITFFISAVIVFVIIIFIKVFMKILKASEADYSTTNPSSKTPSEHLRFCPNCGSNIELVAVFCPYCGAQL
jgi:hypothetical protein